jgi:hypothetical protein
MFEVINHGHHSDTQERTEGEDNKDFRGHQSNDSKAATAQFEYGVDLTLTQS